MSCRGDLLDLIEARERVNRDLKRQDRLLERTRQILLEQEGVHNELFASWRIVNNELSLAAAEVFPAEGVLAEENAPLPGLDELRAAVVEAERADMGKYYAGDAPEAEEPDIKWPDGG